MSIPEWTKDEQSIDAAKNYLRQGGTVDFFETVARSILHNHPEDPARHALEMVNDIIEGRELSPITDFHPKKLDDSPYMRRTNISEFLDEWVLAMLRERPDSETEAIEFHKRYLESLISNS